MRTRHRPYYLLRPRLRREPLGMLDLRTMVSRDQNYVYIRVPKAANSTVVRALLDHGTEQGAEAASGRELGDLTDAKSQAVHFGDLGFAGLWALRRAFVFTVVRNPYARTLSAYLDKFSDGARHLDRFGERIAARDDGAVSFRGFCRYLAAGGEAENAHWMRQTRLTGLADRLDFVGHVETLDADLRHILETIGASPSRPFERAGPPPTGAASRLAEHYDDETRRIVEDVYAADFAAFGYRPGALGEGPVRSRA